MSVSIQREDNPGHKKRCISVILVILLVITLIGLRLNFARERYTLHDIYKRALERSNLIKSGELLLQVAEIDRERAYAQRMPLLTLQSQYTRIGEITSIVIPIDGQPRELMFGNPNRINAGVQFQMPVYAAGRINGKIRIAEKQYLAAQMDKRALDLKVIDQILRSYYTTLYYDTLVGINERNVDWALDHLETVENRYNSGHVPRTDLLRAQVQLRNARNILQEFRNLLEQSRLNLAILSDLERGDFELEGELKFESTRFQEEKLIEHALHQRSDYLKSQLQVDIIRQRLQIASRSNYPSVNFQATYYITNGFDPMQPDKFVDNWNMGIQLNFPIFEPFPASLQSQQLNYQLSIVRYQLEELKKQIILEVKSGILYLQQAENRIQAEEESLTLARKALETARAQYESGLISSLELVDTQRNYYQTEQAYIQALYNHVNARINLCRTIQDYSWFLPELEGK